MTGDGIWDLVLPRLLAEADAAGLVDWSVSVDSTIARAHQHATNITRLTRGRRQGLLLADDPWASARPRDHRNVVE
ncbi:hypothetical protein [Amycolatopsis jiangsuensis]|uniref:Transposase n=1 Tax=Amycolatopsis jiangsuensis TaxID=1181879 RepID=A0A840J1Q2_9PSEU|nr:hypothetical protein [Amycolatopsis jiangsuensis]